MLRWAIASRGQRIGHAALRLAGAGYADYEIAIDLPAQRGRGHGTATTRLLLGYAFATLNLRRVRLLVDGRNRRARTCYTRCGFVPVVRWRAGRLITITMVCPNPALPDSGPLRRTLQLPAAALRGHRLQLTRADLAFLGAQPGQQLAIDAAAGELLITTPQPDDGPPGREAVAVDLSEEEHDRLTRVAAHLGLSPAALIGELIDAGLPSRSPRAAALRAA